MLLLFTPLIQTDVWWWWFDLSPGVVYHIFERFGICGCINNVSFCVRLCCSLRLSFSSNLNHYGMVHMASVSDVLLDTSFTPPCQRMGAMVSFRSFQEFTRLVCVSTVIGKVFSIGNMKSTLFLFICLLNATDRTLHNVHGRFNPQINY